MNKHVLFLVHGMGVHQEKDWANGVIEKLKELSKNYSYFNRKKLEDEIEFVPINYDDILSEVLNKWQKDAKGITNFAKENGLKFSAALNWLDNAGDTEKNFLWSDVADVIIYRFFPLYRERIRISVIRQLAEEINKQINESGDARCSVLAHSLGTAVIHDSLHYLGTEKWGETTNVFGPTHWRFQSIFMIANTSRLLQTVPKAYNSIVKPGPNLDDKSYCYMYFNFRHGLDAVPFPRMFDPAGWGANYKPFVVRHYRDWHIHGFEHYLDNPRVHIPILRELTGRWKIKGEEEKEAANNYEQFGGKLKPIQRVKDILIDLEKLKHELGEDPKPGVSIKGLVEFYQIISNFKKTIEDIS